MHSQSVIVVGGGVIGLCCAYELARRGAAVTVLERGLPGAETTITTGGGLRLQFSTRAAIAMSLLSFETWDHFEAKFGVDPRFQRIGYAYFARQDATAKRFAEAVALQQRHGVPSEWLDRRELQARWPCIPLDPYVAATFCARDGWLDHHAVVCGLYRGAVAVGARIETGVDVTGFIERAGRIVGVESTHGNWHADTVVNAAGGWARLLARKAGVAFPLRSHRLPLLLVDIERELPPALPWLYDVDGAVHVRRHSATWALMGGFLRDTPAVDPECFDRRPMADWDRRVIDAVASAFPLFDPSIARLARGWAGLFSATPDALPILEVARPGLVTCAGFAGAGLMHAPAAGIAVAELVIDGAVRSIDASGLASSRFVDPDAEFGLGSF